MGSDLRQLELLRHHGQTTALVERARRCARVAPDQACAVADRVLQQRFEHGCAGALAASVGRRGHAANPPAAGLAGGSDEANRDRLLGREGADRKNVGGLLASQLLERLVGAQHRLAQRARLRDRHGTHEELRHRADASECQLAICDCPSTYPRTSSACTAKYGPCDSLRMELSKPSDGVLAAGCRAPGCSPASSSQLCTAVAPFQLAYAVRLASPAGPSASAGASAGAPLQGS